MALVPTVMSSHKHIKIYSFIISPIKSCVTYKFTFYPILFPTRNLDLTCSKTLRLLRTEMSRGRTETLQGNPKLSGTANDDSQRQGSMRTWLKL